MSAVELIKKAKKTQAQDAILDVAHDIENIESREQAEEMALSLVNGAAYNNFQLGGIFSVIESNGWFEGHKNFQAYVSEVFGFKIQKARNYMTTYKKLVEEQISWDDVKDIEWTKVFILASILTKENVAMWVGIAKDINCDTLRAKVAAHIGGAVIDESAPVTTDIVKMAFTVHLDQKETIRAALEKAKGEVNTEFDTVALENICVGYLGGSVAVNTPSLDLKGSMKAAGWEATLEMFGSLFPEIEVNVTSPY